MTNKIDDNKYALYLDPASPLSDEENSTITGFGLTPIPVLTLDDLKLAITKARVAIIRLVGDTSLFDEVQELMRGLGHIIPVICRVDRDKLEIAVQAMRKGAHHVIAADEWSDNTWNGALAIVEASLEKPKQAYVFVDPVSKKLVALAQRVAKAEVSTLLVGPSGAGKEVLARILHDSSSRSAGPFVALNCAAMPENLIEDMLFGHEKGAFTGAGRETKGLFEQANGGSLFLDEIGDMPFQLQTKLLRVLQEKKLTRLGGQSSIELDVRFITATNKDLKEAIKHREFREDLYFRISAFKLRVPSLTERPRDILPLTDHLLSLHAEGDRSYTLSDEAQGKLMEYLWPGNVRELSNVVQRALVMCPGTRITGEHLLFDDLFNFEDEQVQEPVLQRIVEEKFGREEQNNNQHLVESKNLASEIADHAEEEDSSLDSAIKNSEQRTIIAALKSCSSRLEAAKQLGISPRTLRYKLARYRDNGLSLAGLE